MIYKTAHGERSRVSKTCDGLSRTKQSFKDECDINNILLRWQKTGVVEHLNRFRGDYSDFTGVQDYQSSLNAVMAADEAFSTLPSSIRKYFANSPAEFLNFVSNPANQDEMIRMGLATRKPTAVDNSSEIATKGSEQLPT